MGQPKCGPSLISDAMIQDESTRELKIKNFRIFCENGIEISSETDKPSNLRMYKDGLPIAGAYGFRINGSYYDQGLMILELMISEFISEKNVCVFPGKFVKI